MIFLHFQVWIQFCGIGSILWFGSVLKRAGSVLAPDPVPVKGRFGPGRAGRQLFSFGPDRPGRQLFLLARAGPGGPAPSSGFDAKLKIFLDHVLGQRAL